jgi:hypothetical protein
MSSNVKQFPDRKHQNEMDRVGDALRDLTRYNDELTYAESIALLELVKFEVMRDMQVRGGGIEED